MRRLHINSTSASRKMPSSTGGEDESHINGLGFVGGDLCESGIGRNRGRSWAETSRGFIYNTGRGELLADGIAHPHSMLSDGGGIWTCSSQDNRVLYLRSPGNPGKARKTPGDLEEHERFDFPTIYLRGFALDGHALFAGSSKRRTRSLSTGEETGVSREKSGECSLWKRYRDGAEAERIVDFSAHRDEIYDLLPIPSPSRGPH